MDEFRIEKDSLGEVRVPINAWYGAQTARAVANFPISGRGPDSDFILAHVRVKLAAARANCQPGWLSEAKRDAIVAACERILAGE
jgi:aspartate ammonia-lyase